MEAAADNLAGQFVTDYRISTGNAWGRRLNDLDSMTGPRHLETAS